MTYEIDNKIVGKLDNKGVFRKVVSQERHLFRRLNGYGIQNWILRDLEAKGCKEIRIREKDTGEVITVPFRVFYTHGKRIHYSGGPQTVLPLHYFANKRQPTLV